VAVALLRAGRGFEQGTRKKGGKKRRKAGPEADINRPTAVTKERTAWETALSRSKESSKACERKKSRITGSCSGAGWGSGPKQHAEEQKGGTRE